MCAWSIIFSENKTFKPRINLVNTINFNGKTQYSISLWLDKHEWRWRLWEAQWSRNTRNPWKNPRYVVGRLDIVSARDHGRLSLRFWKIIHMRKLSARWIRVCSQMFTNAIVQRLLRNIWRYSNTIRANFGVVSQPRTKRGFTKTHRKSNTSWTANEIIFIVTMSKFNYLGYEFLPHSP